MGTGAGLEELIRKSVAKQADAGLWLLQTGPRFVGKVQADGQAAGRLIGRGGLDFIGYYGARFVTFDAKSCANKTSFPLANIEHHQAVIVRKAHEAGALAFFLLEFSKLGPCYYALTWPTLRPFWEAKRKADYCGGDAPASIPVKLLEAECLPIRRGRGGLDLVAALEAIIGRQAA